jgi:hypothetical protein
MSLADNGGAFMATPGMSSPVRGGASRLDRVLELVTEHEGHYREQARRAAARPPCPLIR